MFRKAAIRAIASFDGNLIPTQQQDFIIYTFLDNSLEPAAINNMVAKLTLKIRDNDQVQDLSLVSPIEAKKDGISRTSFAIPHNALPGEANLSIIDEQDSVAIAFDNNLRVGSNPAMAVIPPDTIALTGDHLKFKIATFCPKTGEPIPRAPLRIQMFSSSEIMTVNRVIHSDISGNALFSTHINREAPEGLYRVEFSFGDKRQIFKVHILGRQRSNAVSATIMNANSAGSAIHSGLWQNTSAQIPPIEAEYQLQTDNESPQINDFSIEENRLFFKYDSKNSGFRQIEIWQNGKAHFSSELPFVSGRSSLTLPDSIKPGQPASVHLLFTNGEMASMSKQSFIKTGNTAELQTLLQAAKLLKPHQHQLLNNLLSSDSDLTFISYGFRPDFSNEIFNQITIEPAAAQLTVFPALELKNKARTMLERSAADLASNRFAIVEKDIDMGKIPIKSLRIWLSPRKFYHNLISNLYNTNSTAQSLATEIEARTLGYEMLTLPEQNAEIELLEGLLLPLSEVITYLEHQNTEFTEPHFKMFVRAGKRLGNLIQIPEQTSRLLRSFEPDDDLIGPAPPVLRDELSISHLTNALRPGGRARLETADGATMINLTGDTVVYDLSSLSISSQQSAKLVNLRTYPIVVEFISR